MAVIIGGRTVDVLTGTNESDTISGYQDSDFIYGGAGNDVLNGGTGNDLILGGDGNDLIAGEGDDDVLYGEAGIDNLVGGSGNDYLDGGVGDDQLLGGTGNDHLAGGFGTDSLRGGVGNDIYLYDLGHGRDTIIDGLNGSTIDGTNDQLQLGSSILKANVIIGKGVSGDLLLGIKGSAQDMMRVTQQFLNPTSFVGVERIQLFDNNYVTKTELNTLIQSMGTYATANGISLASLSQIQANATLMTMIATAFHP